MTPDLDELVGVDLPGAIAPAATSRPTANPSAPLRASASHWATLNMPFRGADPLSQELGGWTPPLTSPAAELWGQRDPLVARAQDIARNNGFASGIKQTQVDSVIGSRWRLAPRPNWHALGLDFQVAAKWSRDVEAKWRSYADGPGFWVDAARRQRFAGLLRTQFITWFLAGEHCAIMKWRPDRVGPGRARYSTAVQLIDPDRLSNPYGMAEMPTLRQGVRIDPATGEPLGYHFRDAHPADWPNAFAAVTWTYVPRETPWGRALVIHGFETERDGQVRGKPPMAAIIEALRLLDVYERGEAVSTILNSLYATTLETDFGADPELAGEVFGKDPTTGAALPPNVDMRLRGVKVPVLPAGVHLKFNAPARPAAAQFKEFEAAFLRRVAAATGLSYEQVSRDYSQTNYSSARAALLEAWKFLSGRASFMAESFADIVYACWLEEAIDLGEVLMPKGAPGFYDALPDWVACRWIGPGRGWIDPVKEVQASVMKIDAGLSHLENEAAEQGEDWREVAEQRAYEAAELKRLGLADSSSKVYLATAHTIAKDDEPGESAEQGA
jgi:lambda family phage portal protein